MCLETTWTENELKMNWKCQRLRNDLHHHFCVPDLQQARISGFHIRYKALGSRANFWRPFWKVWNVEACIDFLVFFHPLKTPVWREKNQFTFTSCLCTISGRFWWHTAGENIDTYEGTSQQQKVSHCCLPGLSYVRVSWSKWWLNFQG